MKAKIIRSLPEARMVTKPINPADIKFIIIPVETNMIENNLYAKVESSKTSNLKFGDKSDVPEYKGLNDPNWEDSMMVGIPSYEFLEQNKKIEWRFFDDDSLVFHPEEIDHMLNNYSVKVYKGVERLLGKEKMKPFKDLWDNL